jgi:hypothetical protein
MVTAISAVASAQDLHEKINISWSGTQSVSGENHKQVKALCAPGIHNPAYKNYTPEYFKKIALPAHVGSCNILITHTQWEPVTDDQLKTLTYPLMADDTLSPIVETGTERGVKMLMLSLVPVVVNPAGGFMRLTSFTIEVVYIPLTEDESALKSNAYAAHSVLAQGEWYKIQLDQTGIYKMTYADIQAMGVDMTKVKPGNIRLFGNGGGLLPEANIGFRYDDLAENAIGVVTATAGVFAPGDYLLFYGTSPHKITFDKTAHKFGHTLNIYSDYTSYFLNFDGGPGRRISDEQQSALTPDYTSTCFTESVFFEKDQQNLIKSGKDWVGERMDYNTPAFELPEYSFPNLQMGKQAWIRYRLVASSTSTTTFTVNVNGKKVSTPSCGSNGDHVLGTERYETKSFYPETDKVNVSFRYNGEGASIGWLDWVELNIPRDLTFTGGQMAFADPYSVFPGFVTDFQLQAASPEVKIWEVTDPVNVTRVLAAHQGSMVRFAMQTDSIRQFVAWDNTAFLKISSAGKVPNQDLHGIASADMLIVTNKDFLGEANRLAEHHRSFDGFNVSVVSNEQVYNEFSSGSPDIAAIRDFARLLYKRPEPGSKLRYLLLFGDGSYDYKDHLAGNTNRVLTFQTKESLSTVVSYACDDFYGELDDTEGYDASGLIDIGIGRFPVNTAAEAKSVVDKCISYATAGESSFGDWRNKICLTCDDGNGNTHFDQADDDLAPLLEKSGPVFNVVKIYMDAFKQLATPIGERCPDANTAINTNVENGVLIINYTGHGGEVGWADESILSIRDIDAWTNYAQMPVFMTATCEFSRYDDPERVSAGEHVLLNPLGGGIALFTTTRLAVSGINIRLNIHFYDTLLSYNNGAYPRFGDVIAFVKNQFFGGDVDYIRNFVLLGDPALHLAYPKYDVITTQINGRETGQQPDTISAMTPVEIKGIVADGSGNKMTGFSGVLDVKVFDKERTLLTLGSDPTDHPAPYKVQDNYIYQGRATVTNGDFTVNFIVPRDIDYSYGPGKVSYYAHNATADANGYTRQLIIGGSGNESADISGPQIALFMNDTGFNDGGITGDTPALIARLRDESGINTISNAIGHDIVATIDGDYSSSVILNSFYSADLDSYRSGVVNYKLSPLAEGPHSLRLKAWDVFNNSSEATINFTVAKNMQITITGTTVIPNPFRDEVNVEFDINLFDSPVEAHLEVFNINGSLVSSTEPELMLSQGYKAGKLTWNGLSDSGETLPPGVYLLTIRASNGKSETVKACRVVKVR